MGVDLEFFSFLKNSLLDQLLALIPNLFAVFQFVARLSTNRRPNLENLRFLRFTNMTGGGGLLAGSFRERL